MKGPAAGMLWNTSLLLQVAERYTEPWAELFLAVTGRLPLGEPK